MKLLRNLLAAALICFAVPALALVQSTPMRDANITLNADSRNVAIISPFTAARSLTLPPVGATNIGQSGAATYYQNQIMIVDAVATITVSNTLTINPASGDTINGGGALVISTAGAIVKLYPTTSNNWKAEVTGPQATPGTVSSIICGTGLDGGTITTTGTCSLSAARRTLPTVQRFTSGSGTYTTPANVLWIEVLAIGGGGGGGGSGTAGQGAGTNGGATTFGSSVITANGGTASGAGGSPTIAGGAIDIGSVPGGSGGGAQYTSNVAVQPSGGDGGNSCLGGGGGGGIGSGGGGVGNAGTTNSGGGGGGGGASNATLVNTGTGGGAGACAKAIINTPSASYPYAVGAAGSAGGAGTSGVAGGAGAAGLIVVIEHYGT